MVFQDEERLVVAWDNVTGATHYEANLRFAINNSVVLEFVGTEVSSNNTLTIFDLFPGFNYTLEICSVNSAGNSCTLIDVYGCK